MSVIDQIKDGITITQLWQRLSLPGEPKVGMNLCPFHGEKSPSLSILKGDRKFHCFGCGASSDVIDFYCHATGLPKNSSEAIRRLADILNLQRLDYKPLIASRASGKLDIIKAARPVSGSTIEIPQTYLDWAESKGIYASTVAGMVREGSISFVDGVVHYHYNTGIKVRYDMSRSNSSRWISGSPQNGIWRMAKLTKFSLRIVVMCEGESDTMAMEQELLGKDQVEAVGIPQASFIPSPALAQLIGSNRTVILCFDNDNAGRLATRTVGDLIRTHATNCNVINFPWFENCDPKDFCALDKEQRANKLVSATILDNLQRT